MTTYVQAVNGVLRRLRESTVAAYNTTDYSTLISEWVNDAKREIEDAWDWQALREEKTITAVVGQEQYFIPGSTERTRIRQQINDTQDAYLIPVLSDAWLPLKSFGTQQNNIPQYYRFRGWDNSKVILVHLWPTPSTTDSLIFECLNPQADLTSSNTDIVVPGWLVIQRALVDALEERGDDGGQAATRRMEIFQRNLATAIAQDAGRARGESDWVVV